MGLQAGEEESAGRRKEKGSEVGALCLRELEPQDREGKVQGQGHGFILEGDRRQKEGYREGWQDKATGDQAAGAQAEAEGKQAEEAAKAERSLEAESGAT